MLWTRHLLLAFLALAWCSVILGYPWLVGGSAELPLLLSLFFSNICHQLPERSFHLAAVSLPVCVRCASIYSGGLAGIVVYPALAHSANVRRWMQRLLVLSALLVASDVFTDMVDLWRNTPLSRSITGGFFGCLCGLYLAGGVQRIKRPSRVAVTPLP